jgi:hypothetical protein
LLVFTPTVRGSGRFTGAFASPDGAILAVASAFPLLTNPPARAAYGGQRLRYRLALHRRGETAPFAWFDDLSLPINAVAFHPTDPVVAIGAGSYDGGWLFEGDLVFWDWTADRAWRPLTQTPEVARCAFDASGERLDVTIRPWDEEWGRDENPADAFERYYPLVIAYRPADPGEASQASVDPLTAVVIDHQDLADSTGRIVDDQQLADWFAVASLVQRGAIWDVAWLDDGRLAAVHDDCQLEVHDLARGEVKRFDGEGSGVAILRTSPPIIHVAPSGHARAGAPYARLMVFADDALTEVHRFDGIYAFSASGRDQVLGRLDRRVGTGLPRDLLIDALKGEVRQIDLGHYDCFNHYLGVDGAPDLYFLQGAPPSSHKHKWMCRLRPDGRVERLWPLLRDDGSHASHAMECLGHAIEDGPGAGLVVAGRHYEPIPSGAVQGFIYRKPLDANREIWRHATASSTSAIAHLPGLGLVAAAFLDGTLSLFDAATGAIRATGPTTIDGVPTVIFAMDARGDILAVGTFDGRIATLSARALIEDDVVDGPIAFG